MLSALILLAARDAKIDLEFRAGPLKDAVAEVARKSGQKLEAEGPISDQIVYIRVKDVEIEELKKKLAAAVVGTWDKKDDRLILKRLPSQQQAVRNDYLATRERLISAELKKFEKQLEKQFQAKELLQGLAGIGSEPKPGTDRAQAMAYWQKYNTLIQNGPMARFARRLVLCAKPADLAKVGPYERWIFTTTPTKRQMPIDKTKYEAAVKAYAREQSAWSEAAKNYDFGEDPGGRMVSDPRAQVDYNPNANDFRFAYSRGDMTGLGMINVLGGFDPTGSRQIVTQIDLAGPEREFLNSVSQPQAASGAGPLVNFSPESKTMLDGYMGMMSQRKSPVLDPELKTLLLDPEHHDPLSFGVSDILHDYSDSTKSNVVASLGDSVFNWSIFVMSQQSPRLNIAIETFRKTGGVIFDEADGWAVLTPGYRYEEEMNFTPRKPLGELIRATAKRGALDMVDFSDFAFRSNRVQRRGMETFYLGMLDTSTLSLMDRSDWNTFKLYGGLSPEQRNLIEQDGTVAVKGLSPALLAIIDRMVYNGEIRSETSSASGITRVGNPVEPTESYANALPLDAVIAGQSSSHETIVAYGRGADGKPKALRSLDAYNLASIETDVVGKPELMANYGVPDLLGYAMGKQKMLRLRVILEPGIWKEGSILLNDFDEKAKPVAWDKLPEEIVKQIKQGFEQVKEMKARQRQGTPPPSR